MKEEYSSYLKQIGITGLFYNRAKEVYEFYEKLYPGAVQDVFVTDYIDSEGKRQYENLWFFTSTLVLEAKRFLTEDNFDSAPLKKKVQRWQVNRTEYNFEKASTKSRLSITVELKFANDCTLKASQENCDHLRDIFIKHIVPNTID